jgi:hypothetical protein
MGAHDFIEKSENAFNEVRALLKKIFSEEGEKEIKVKNYPGHEE